jgi:hypothetical protein
MPNHVHLLLEPLPITSKNISFIPCWPPVWATEVGRTLLSAGLPDQDVQFHKLERIMQSLKGRTSRTISQVLGIRTPVWFSENFDHWVRDGDEYARLIQYIDNNPVSAGLCRKAEEWPWSSAGELSADTTPMSLTS